MHEEWLERPPKWIEAGVFVIVGGTLGSGLLLVRRRVAMVAGIGTGVGALFVAASLTQFSNYWFPWLIVAGAQVPLALFFALSTKRAPKLASGDTIVIPPTQTVPLTTPEGEPILVLPDYELVDPPFGKGAYGKVWLARNAVGQWQALKAVYRARFGDDPAPFEREFRGVEYYKPISREHPGLLCVDFVSRIKPDGYFYYVMELADAVTPGWENNPPTYKPLDLAAFAESFPRGRIPVTTTVALAVKLCSALEFLHARGLTHRDIKPRNILIVKGEPKLADVGLLADASRPVEDITWVGTPGYMPPNPEPPGTTQADIYALGMVLYVVTTGSKPKLFPELSQTLLDASANPEFNALSDVVFKACHPDRSLRYATATEMLAALRKLDAELAAASTKPVTAPL